MEGAWLTSGTQWRKVWDAKPFKRGLSTPSLANESDLPFGGADNHFEG